MLITPPAASSPLGLLAKSLLLVRISTTKPAGGDQVRQGDERDDAAQLADGRSQL
jgi:hypothetical protein